jgi:chromate transporter
MLVYAFRRDRKERMRQCAGVPLASAGPGACNAAMQQQRTAPPSLLALFWVFLAVGMQSFGGGLSGWIRRAIVERRGWMSEAQFLSGLALCQITPGPNAVNLAVFIGTTLRGHTGALSAVAGILGLPMVVVLALGALFATVQNLGGVESAMTGIGAVAIGFNLATGLRMARRGVVRWEGAAIALAASLAVGLLGVNLLLAVLVLVPLGLATAPGSRR